MKYGDVNSAIKQIPDGWYLERLFRYPTGWLVSLSKYDGLGVGQAQDVGELAQAILDASASAKRFDKDAALCT